MCATIPFGSKVSLVLLLQNLNALTKIVHHLTASLEYREPFQLSHDTGGDRRIPFNGDFR